LSFGAALAEAQDINLHLRPLRAHFEEIEQADFEDLQKHLEPMMHVVCLVWASSNYYNTPARIIILLQEICNLIIVLVRRNHFVPMGELQSIVMSMSVCLSVYPLT